MDHTHYVIDGSSLLQRIPWASGNTYAEIGQSFIHLLQNNYVSVENITLVFDGGFLNHSTEDTTQLRRSNSEQGRRIVPTLPNPQGVRLNEFLKFKHSKQEFRMILGNEISDAETTICHADADADFPVYALLKTDKRLPCNWY